MKKVLLVLFVIFLLIVGALIAVPYLFKDEIVARVKTEINKNIKGEVSFGDFDLSLIRNFPNLAVSVKELRVVGAGAFEKDTLADIGSFRLVLDIMSVIRQAEQMTVREVILDEPRIHIRVLKDGTANYDILITDTTQVAEDATEPTTFNVGLNYYAINDGYLIYDDELGGTYVEAIGLNHEGNGDFTQDIFTLETNTLINSLTVQSGGVPYLNKVETALDADIEIDNPNSKYTLQDNELRLNALVLGFDGYVAMPGEPIEMDMTFEAKQTDFRNIMSLLPNVYTKDFEDVQTSGQLALNGFVKGEYIGESYPAFDINLSVDNGTFQYPDLPASVSRVNIDANVKHPGGDLNQMVINVPTLSMLLGNDPFEMSMTLTDPIEDPNIDARAQGKIDLSNVPSYYPMEGVDDLQGIVDMNVAVNGRISDVEAGRYERFNASGNASVSNLVYESADLPDALTISTMDLTFNPKNVTLSNFDAKIGESDLKASGSIDNLIAYALKDDVLKGSFNVTSNYFNTNRFITESAGEEDEPAVAEGSDTVVYKVPDNLDFVMSARFGTVLYEDIEMKNVTGNVIIRDEKLWLKDFRALVLDGAVTINASYSTKDVEQPQIDFTYDIQRISIGQAYQTFNTIQTIAPVARFLEGTFSSDFTIQASLTNNMDLDYRSLIGNGVVRIPSAQLKNFTAINKIAERLNYEKLKNLRIEDAWTVLKIENGRVNVQPFTIDALNTKMNVSGSHGIDNTLDYKVNLQIPRTELGSANQAVNSMVASSGIPGLQQALPDNLNFIVSIGGTMDDPQISVGLDKESLTSGVKDLFKQQKEAAEQKAREEAEKLKEEAEQRVREEAQKAKQEAEQRAREAAEKARKEAEERARKEKERLEKEAKEKIKGIFGPK